MNGMRSRPAARRPWRSAWRRCILSERTTAPADANALSRRARGLVTPDRSPTPPASPRTLFGGWRASSSPRRQALRWPAGSAPSIAAPSTSPRRSTSLNYVAGNVGQTVQVRRRTRRRGWIRRDGAAHRRHERRADRGAAGPRRQPGCMRCRAQRNSPKPWPRCPSRSAPRSSSTKPPPPPICCLPSHHPLERWDDLRPRAGVRGLMQPGHDPGLQHHASRRCAAQRRPRKRAAPWRRFSGAILRGPSQAAVGRARAGADATARLARRPRPRGSL